MKTDTITDAMAMLHSGPWTCHDGWRFVWRTYLLGPKGDIAAGGSVPCEDVCTICGGPNTAAFDGEGWCDNCDEDARL